MCGLSAACCWVSWPVCSIPGGGPGSPVLGSWCALPKAVMVSAMLPWAHRSSARLLREAGERQAGSRLHLESFPRAQDSGLSSPRLSSWAPLARTPVSDPKSLLPGSQWGSRPCARTSHFLPHLINPGWAFNCFCRNLPPGPPFPLTRQVCATASRRNRGDAHKVCLSVTWVDRLGRGSRDCVDKQEFSGVWSTGHWSGEKEMSWNIDSVFGFPEKEQFD